MVYKNEGGPHLSIERISRAKANLSENPYDIESWNIVIRDLKTKPIDEIRDVYEKLVNQFPNHGKFWKIYIEAEMKSKNYEKVEKLFQRCLIKILSIDLWLCYLSYIKEAKANQPNFKERLAQAYEFTLDKVGIDYKAAPIWAGQIEFLKNIEAVGSYAENQKIAAIRKVYHKACVTPMLNMEQFWREYIAFEQAINPLIAKKLTDELSKEYMSSRRALKEMEALTRGLNRSNPATPITGSSFEQKQIDIWKKYLTWEKKNPLNYEDRSLLIKRIQYAYEQCLQNMSFYSEFWVDAGLYLQQASKELLTRGGDSNASKLLLDKTSETYEKATASFFKTHMFMHFVQADFEESRENYTKAESVYSNLLEPSLPQDPINNDITLVYIEYMRFSKRMNGLKGARTVFKKAREDSRVKHQVYTCAAMMEYYTAKDKNIALKIYELGLKKYSNDMTYLTEYLNFSFFLNDDNNTRVLFERIISLTMLDNVIPTEHISNLWNQFLQFEIEVGDYNNILKVDQRRVNALEKVHDNTSHVETNICTYLVDRYRYRDLLPCSKLDRRLMGYRDSKPNTTPTTSSKDFTVVGTGVSPTALLSSPAFLQKLMSTLSALKAATGLGTSTESPNDLSLNIGTGSSNYSATDIATALLLLKDEDLVALSGNLSMGTSFPDGAHKGGYLRFKGSVSKPDLSQMMPFKPQKSTTSNEVGLVPINSTFIPQNVSFGSGKVIYSSYIDNFLSNLPQTEPYQGPFVFIDSLLQMISTSNVVETAPDNILQSNLPISQYNPSGSKNVILAPNATATAKQSTSSPFYETGEEPNKTPPINDIYRIRQLQKSIK